MSKPYQRVTGARIKSTMFDLSNAQKLTCDMGELIPVMAEELVPGDRFNISVRQTLRFQPLVAPILHDIEIYTHFFFVPIRLLWDEWETFITRGVSGEETPSLPLWKPKDANGIDTVFQKYSIADYLRLPLGVSCKGVEPVDFPKRAYNLIWNEFYRDNNLQDEVDIVLNEKILYRNWAKDYFTSSLPFQQRGTAPSLPLSGALPILIDFTGGSFDGIVQGKLAMAGRLRPTENTVLDNQPVGGDGFASMLPMVAFEEGNTSDSPADQYVDPDKFPDFTSSPAGAPFYVNLNDGATFDIATMRLATQIQRWQERSARGGSRYTEFLNAHYGVSPKDSRLQRPEYIGGTKNDVIISEVLQTSSTDSTTPQGNLAGHGIGLNISYAAKYRAEEFGIIVGVMSVMPHPVYASQGVPRQWIKRTTWDYYNPLFAHLSEQAIFQGEILATDDEVANTRIFGYQAHWDEMRVRSSGVAADMRDTFAYWHLARFFDPESPPVLNGDFVACKPRKDIFAVQDEKGLIIDHGNVIKAVRPLPYISDPGYLDH